MSNRERIVQLLDIIPDYKMGYILAYVQGIAADEESDDIFVKGWLKTMKVILILKKTKHIHLKS